MLTTADGQYQLYEYKPSIYAALAAAAVFGVFTALHVFQMVRSKTYYNLPFIIGGLFETFGYGARAGSHSNRQATMPYIAQSLLILLAPALLAATIYMTLARVMAATRGQYYSLVPFKWLTKIFVMGDVLSFFTQCTGGGLMASDGGKNANMGQKIILGGLLIQIIWFGFFVVTVLVYQIRMTRGLPTAEAVCIPWKKMVWVLYLASILIMGRSIFRVAEYAIGRGSFLLKNEWCLYAFDAAQMAQVMAAWFIWHPSMISNAEMTRHRRLESHHSQELPLHETGRRK